MSTHTQRQTPKQNGTNGRNKPSWTTKHSKRCRALIKTKLFKPGYTRSELNDFIATHEIFRMETYPHARKAGLGNYVGITYRKEDSNGESIDKSPTGGN